jgi:hypothetical protein
MLFFSPRLAPNSDPPISTSQIAGIIGANYHAGWEFLSILFLYCHLNGVSQGVELSEYI